MRIGSGSSSSKSRAWATPANAPASTENRATTRIKRKRMRTTPCRWARSAARWRGAGYQRVVSRRTATVLLVAEPARWGLRRTLLDGMDRLHLARPAVQLYELALAGKSTVLGGRPEEAGGLPLPPARLRAQIGPLHADAAFFLRSGERHAELIRDLLRENGSSIDDVGALLDWGCG